MFYYTLIHVHFRVFNFNQLPRSMRVSIFDIDIEGLLSANKRKDPKSLFRFTKALSDHNRKRPMNDEEDLIQLMGAINNKVPFLPIYNKTAKFIASVL